MVDRDDATPQGQWRGGREGVVAPPTRVIGPPELCSDMIVEEATPTAGGGREEGGRREGGGREEGGRREERGRRGGRREGGGREEGGRREERGRRGGRREGGGREEGGRREGGGREEGGRREGGEGGEREERGREEGGGRREGGGSGERERRNEGSTMENFPANKPSLVPRPHPAHARRRGLVSQVQILGPAPETRSGQ